MDIKFNETEKFQAAFIQKNFAAQIYVKIKCILFLIGISLIVCLGFDFKNSFILKNFEKTDKLPI